MIIQSQRQDPSRVVARGITNNHSRAVARGLTQNHSRAVARGVTSNHSRAVARGLSQKAKQVLLVQQKRASADALFLVFNP